MKHLLILVFCLVTSTGHLFAQGSPVHVSPGTAIATIEWLEIHENGLVCDIQKPSVAKIKIEEIKATGSGLVTPPTKGDTLQVELRIIGNLSPAIHSKQECMLIENPCLQSHRSYYSIFLKKD